MRGKQLNLFGGDMDGGEGIKRYSVLVPIDTIILLVVVIILLLTLSFSSGVEMGRRMAYLNSNVADTISLDDNSGMPEATAAPSEPDSQHPSEITMLVERLREDSEEEPDVKPQPATSVQSDHPKELLVSEGGYFIQVATYLKDSTASKEAEELKSEGYPVEIKKKGKFVVVYVGGFADKNVANIIPFENFQGFRFDFGAKKDFNILLAGPNFFVSTAPLGFVAYPTKHSWLSGNHGYATISRRPLVASPGRTDSLYYHAIGSCLQPTQRLHLTRRLLVQIISPIQCPSTC